MFFPFVQVDLFPFISCEVFIITPMRMLKNIFLHMSRTSYLGQANPVRNEAPPWRLQTAGVLASK